MNYKSLAAVMLVLKFGFKALILTNVAIAILKCCRCVGKYIVVINSRSDEN